MASRAESLDLVDLAHRLDLDDATWLKHLGAELRGALEPLPANASIDAGSAGPPASPLDAVSVLMRHVAAALRLRVALDRACATGARPAPANGLGAEDREALRRALEAIERARSRRRAPLDLLLARELLQRGRCVIVEEHERRGTRYAVARAADADRVRRLFSEIDEREEDVVLYLALGHSAKQIGYELGYSPATVSRCLSRARHALAVTSNVGLVSETMKRVRRLLGR